LKVQVKLIIIYFLQLGYLNSLNQAISEIYRGIKLRVRITTYTSEGILV
jgi:hypothetical protein